MRILHIAAHLGAGVGKAIAGMAVFDSSNEHRIILIQEPAKDDQIKRCMASGTEVIICPSDEILIREAEEADVVIIDWWHHPLVYGALMKISAINARIVIWAHLNGIFYPKLKIKFLDEFDACMYTSQASMNNPDWTQDERDHIAETGSLVYGMGDFDPASFEAKSDYCLGNETVIGYVGSLDYAKLHPDFVKWMKAIYDMVPGVRFMIAGDILPPILKDVEDAGLSDVVSFLGYCGDVPKRLPTFDLFLYPLNPRNFATTENSILEAKAAGLPIITSDGLIERTLIDDDVDGVLISDIGELKSRIKVLIDDPDMRRRLGTTARSKVIRTHDPVANVKMFNDSLNATLSKPKRKHYFADVIGRDEFEWFISGCDDRDVKIFNTLQSKDASAEDKEICRTALKNSGQIYKGKSKASVRQFFDAYPQNESLKNLTAIIEGMEGTDI